MRCGWYYIENEVLCYMVTFTLLHTGTLKWLHPMCENFEHVTIPQWRTQNTEDLALKRIRRTQTVPTPTHFLSNGSSNIYRSRTLVFNHSMWENADGIKGSTSDEDTNALGNKLLPTWWQMKTDKRILGYIYNSS